MVCRRDPPQSVGRVWGKNTTGVKRVRGGLQLRHQQEQYGWCDKLSCVRLRKGWGVFIGANEGNGV